MLKNITENTVALYCVIKKKLCTTNIMIFISDSDVQMGRPRGKHVTAINEQDNEPTYQGIIIIENGMLTTGS